ncbi:MAG: hypothetical protein LBS87_01145 [Puniceicoccales bacterium]|jgi:hypothetical protein|nr:hypothetical protein [Puniceicoccales bacterium]
MESLIPVIPALESAANFMKLAEECKQSRCLAAETHIKLGHNLYQLGEKVRAIGNNPECAIALFENWRTFGKIEGELLMARAAVVVNAEWPESTIDDKLREISRVKQTPVAEAGLIKFKNPMVEKYSSCFETKVGDGTYGKVFGEFDKTISPMIDNLMAKDVSLDPFGTSMERYGQLVIKLIESMRDYGVSMFFSCMDKVFNVLYPEAKTSDEYLKKLGSIVDNTTRMCNYIEEINKALANLTNELHTVTEKIQAQASAA